MCVFHNSRGETVISKPNGWGDVRGNCFLFPPLLLEEGWRGKKQAACPCACVHLYTRHELDCCWNPTKGKISQQMPHSHCPPVTFAQGKGQVDSKHSSAAASCHREFNFHHVFFFSIITSHACSHTQSLNSIFNTQDSSQVAVWNLVVCEGYVIGSACEGMKISSFIQSLLFLTLIIGISAEVLWKGGV